MRQAVVGRKLDLTQSRKGAKEELAGTISYQVFIMSIWIGKSLRLRGFALKLLKSPYG